MTSWLCMTRLCRPALGRGNGDLGIDLTDPAAIERWMGGRRLEVVTVKEGRRWSPRSESVCTHCLLTANEGRSFLACWPSVAPDAQNGQRSARYRPIGPGWCRPMAAGRHPVQLVNDPSAEDNVNAAAEDRM
jgi:hypothetical protein